MKRVARRRDAFPRRISIIGIPGAGKTTLSHAIVSVRTKRQINADRYYWGPNWTISGPDPNAAFRAALNEDGDWIADACVAHAPRELLELPDLVIYLDYSVPRLMLHTFKRWLMHRKHKRPELPEGCEERFPVGSLLEAVTGRLRRLHEEALETYPQRRLVRINTPRELRAFMDAHFAPATKAVPGSAMIRASSWTG